MNKRCYANDLSNFEKDRRKMKFLKYKISRLLLLVLCYCFFSPAYACGLRWGTAPNFFAAMKDPTTVSVGGILSQKTSSFTLATAESGCRLTDTFHVRAGDGYYQTGEYVTIAGKSMPVFETGVPGLGWAIAITQVVTDRTYTGDNVYGIESNYKSRLYNWPGGSVRGFSSISVTLTAVLVKTSDDIKPGTVFPNGAGLVKWIGAWYVNAVEGFIYSTDDISVGGGGVDGGGVIPGTTCNFTNTNLTIPLDPIKASSLKNIGTNTVPSDSPANTVSTTLRCSGTKTVYATVTDRTSVSSRANYLVNSLVGANAATGVGIHLERKVGSGAWTSVSMGPESSTVPATNQWTIGVASSGTFTIQFRASYMRIAGELNSGKIKSRAALTLAYQ